MIEKMFLQVSKSVHITLLSSVTIEGCLASTSLCSSQNYIARFGHGSAKLARQAQSKEKTLQKMVASGLTEKVVNDKVRRSHC